MSVLVPARNAGATVRSALASVAVQTLTDHEVVVVDDGSTDETRAIVRDRASRDGRVRLLQRPARGIVAALNEGLGACLAPFVARFDADDLMHRERLARQVESLEGDPTLSGIGSRVRCFSRPSLRDGMRRYELWLNTSLDPDTLTAQRFVEAPLVHPSVTLRRSALDDVGGWQDAPWPEDWDLWMRLFERGHRLSKLPEFLHFWRNGAARLTRTDPRYALEAHVRLRAHFLVRGPLAKGPPVAIWGAGPVGKSLAKALAGQGVRLVAYVDVDPRKIGQRVHGVPVVAARSFVRSEGLYLLGAVGAPGARDEIRAEALARGFIEGTDFFACA